MISEIHIKRFYQPTQTKGWGKLLVNGIPVKDFKTLELAWRKNERSISCIPEGDYFANKHISPRFGESLWLDNVPNRSEILMHYANFAGSNNPRTGRSDLRGCIAAGRTFADIDGDGIMDITHSKLTMKKILSSIPGNLVIIKIRS